MPAAPTYRTETTAEGQTIYHCLYCAEQGSEHHSTDEALFLAHMEQRHDGRMIEDTEASQRKAPEDHPQGGPPGQTGEHPHGGPPGQTGEHPQGGPPGQAEEGEPTHPIVDPDAPYVEPHEEPKP